MKNQIFFFPFGVTYFFISLFILKQVLTTTLQCSKDEYFHQQHLKTKTHWISQYIIIYIKVRGVRRTANFWNVRCFKVSDVIPIKSFKKGMRLKILYSILSQSTLPAADKSLNKIFCFFRYICNMGWKLKSFLENKANRNFQRRN